VFTGDEAAADLAGWLVEVVDKLGKNELDEATYVLHMRGGSYRFDVRIYRQDQPEQGH